YPAEAWQAVDSYDGEDHPEQSRGLDSNRAMQMGIGRQGQEAPVLNRATHGEMIEILKFAAGQSQQLMKCIVEIAPDARRPHASGLGFEVQNLAEHPRLPKEPAIPPSTILLDRLTEIGNHAQTERAIGRNLLMTANDLGGASQVILRQAIQPQ